jgi:hypothetical protein
MGTLLSIIYEIFHSVMGLPTPPPPVQKVYAIFDPLQKSKPENRSKDIISFKNKNNPSRLDTVNNKGCDTIWKCFKRTVWRLPNEAFLGERRPLA